MTDAGITPEDIRTGEAESASRQDDSIAPEDIRTRDDEGVDQWPDTTTSGITPAAGITLADVEPPSVLDREIPLLGSHPGRRSAGSSRLSVAVALRLLHLDGWALGADEAARAYDAWALFRGQPPVAVRRSRTRERSSGSWKRSASSSSGRATSWRA